MKSKYIFALIFLIGLIYCGIPEIRNDNELDIFLNTPNYALILIVDENCESEICKDYVFEFLLFESILNHDTINLPVSLAKIHTPEQIKKIITQYSIPNEPQIIFFYNNQIFEFEAPLNAPEIINWLTLINNSIVEVQNKEEIDMYQEAAILILKDENPEILKNYKHTSIKHNETNFLLCKNDQCIKEYPEILETTLIYKKQNQEIKLTHLNSVWDIINFVQDNKTHIMKGFSELVAKRIFTSYSWGVFLFYDKEKRDHKFPLFNFHVAFKKYSQIVNFIETEIKYDFETMLAEDMRVFEEDLPLVLIIDASSDDIKKYKLNDAINNDSIVKFIEDFKERRIERFFRSEPVKNVENDLIIEIVSSNYFDFLLKDKRHVIVLFYSPRCPHSMEMMTKVFELLPKYLDTDKVLLLKIDYIKNEIYDVIVTEFPTLRLFHGRNKAYSYVDYPNELPKSLESVMTFIIKQLSSDVLKIAEAKEDL